MPKKELSIRFPVGTMVYPYVTRPDNYKGKEEYKCTLRLPASEAQPFIDKLEKLAEVERQKDTLNNNGEPIKYVDEYMPYEESDGGFVDFKAKLKRTGGNGSKTWTQRPDVFDSNLHPIDESIDVMSGSRGQMVVTPFRWGQDDGKLGISLRLTAVKVGRAEGSA